MDVIEINKLTKYYGKSRGIVDVSFNVKEGEVFGFIGPNGAGKSTTIRTLLSLIYPTSGNAKIFGKDCIKEGKQLRKDIGYLPSEVFYYDNMKVIDLLNYSASFYKNVDETRIKKLSEVMDLDLTKKIDDLSYGNKKKVGIVQGLLHKPKLIILDEPTGGLDPLMQQKFFDLIKEENKSGSTILFSSHILSEVQKMCTRVGIIKSGSMVKIDDISTLQDTNYKKFRIETVDKIKSNYFDIPGMTNLKVNGNLHNFLYQGNINDIISKIHNINIKNLIVEEPSLEEIFMHFYEKEV